MNPKQYDYAVIGGDLRQVYLAKELADNQNFVIYYALANVPNKCTDTSFLTKASSLVDAIHLAKCIIAPIPFSKNGTHLNQNLLENSLSLELLLNMLKPGQSFFAGCIPENFQNKATENGIFIYDLMRNNSLAIYNTLATAEGAICEAIQRSPENLHHSKCAILGYGRCGRTIANYLKGMFCNVSVFSRDDDELAFASTIADNAYPLNKIETTAVQFDFVFNTIPAPILTAGILEKMSPSVTIIDIASSPGGVDYEAAQKLSINASLCLGLPGKYSPYSCAKAIKSVIEKINLKE